MKFKYLVVCIALIFFISLSAVCAETNDTDNQYGSSIGSFTDLESDINDTPNNAIIYLDRDYTFDESCDNRSTFKEGILIDKNITIEGNNHVIDAKNLVRIFNINSDVVIRNVVLLNGFHGYGTYNFNLRDTNGGGAINIIGGGLHLENSTLLNHTAYSSTTPKGTGTESGGGAICVSGNTYLYVDNCNFMDNSVFSGSGNVAGGAIMFKAGSAFNVTNSVFINNSASSSYMGTGGAIGEVNVVDSPKICYITNCTFIDNIANGGFSSILAQTVSMVGNLFINSGVTYSFGAGKTCSYNTFIDCSVSFMHMGWDLVKYNWYGVNPSSRSSDVAASIINEGENIYVKLTTDGWGNNLSNPEYLHSRNVIFKGDVKYDNVDTVNGVAANEITKLLKEGYVYSVNATVDRQNLVLYFKYVNGNNDFNSTVPSFNESYFEVSPGEFKIEGSDKIYHSFYEAVSDALSMDGDATIYVGEGVYSEKWSDNYYNYEYMNYNFDFTSNNKVITVIGAGNDKSVFKGESRGFKINGNSTFRFVNMSFADFTDNIFTFNVTNSDIYFTNCIFRNISTDYGIYLDGENSTLFIDGCYLDNVKTHPFWNAADNSYIVIDSTIFYATNYNYAFSEIYSVYNQLLLNDTNNSYIVINSTIFYGTDYSYRFSQTYLVKDQTNRILTVYHDFDKYYIFKHNFLFGDVTEGFDCTPQVYLSNESIMLGDSVDIIVDFNYFTNSSGTYRFDSNFIDDFTVSINTASGSNTVNLKNGVALLKYTPTDAGTQTIIVKYGSKSKILTLNIDPRQMPSFTVEGTDNIIATLPSDAKGNVTFNVNGNKISKEVVDGIASIDLSPLSDIKYTVEVTYSGDSNYLPASTTLVFSPYRNITYLDIRCSDTLIYTDAIIDVYTNAYGTIKLMIDGEEYTHAINNNVARFTISDLTAGIHNITAVYDGNSQYLPESNTTTINIIKYDPTLTSYVKTVLSGNDVIMNITLNEDITSEVYIFMNGKVYKTNVYNGVGYLNFTRLHGGSYSYRLYFNGNEKYYASEINSGFTVTKLNTIYVDVNNGDDENMGISRSDALKSLKVALECIRYGGTIYICEGLYRGLDNSRLTFTQSVNVIGLGDVTFDGELKNYFFTINEGINVKFKDINFKNIYSYVFNVSRISHVNVENCEFYGGSGSAFINEGVLTITDSTFKNILSEAVILNYATVNVYDSIFDSLTSAPSMGLAISNYGTATIKNSIFKDSTIYGEERVYGLLYNKGYMAVESCIFDSNTAVFVLYPIGTANIYNVGQLNATYNVFIKNNEFDINDVHGDDDHKYIDVYNDLAGSAYIDFNWWDCTDSPYDMHLTNTKPGLWVIYDINIDEYTALDIGDTLDVNVHLTLNNGSYFNDNRLHLYEASFDGIVNQLENYATSFNFNKTSVKASYYVTFGIGGFETEYLIEVGKNHSSMIVNKKDIDYGETLQIKIYVSSDSSIPTGNVTVIIGNMKYSLNLTDGYASVDVDKLLPGTYNFKVVYEGDDDFFKCYYYGNVTVFKQNSYITIDLEDIMVGQKGVAHISIEPDTLVNAKGYIYIDGVRRNIYFYQGKATYELKKFDIGQYDIRVEFLGNDYYYSSNASTVFYVHKYKVNLTLSIDDVYVGQRAYLYIGKDPADLSGEVHFIVEGTTQRDDYAYLNPEQSEARVTLKNLGGGLYNITVFYEGDTKYDPCNASVSFTVLKYTPEFNVNVTYNDTVAHIDFNLSTNKYSAPIGGVIQFWHNDNVTYINVTDGYASYDFNLTEGYNYLFAYYMVIQITIIHYGTLQSSLMFRLSLRARML